MGGKQSLGRLDGAVETSKSRYDFHFETDCDSLCTTGFEPCRTTINQLIAVVVALLFVFLLLSSFACFHGPKESAQTRYIMRQDRPEPASCPCKRLPMCLSSFTSAEYGDCHSLTRHGIRQLARRVDKTTGETPLHLAAQHGQVAATALLLQSGCNVNGSEQSRCTPLHRASFSGAVATMQLLLKETDCNVLAIDTSFGDCMTPLHKAAAGGRFMAVQLLIDNLQERGDLSTALEWTDATDKTPLEVALDRLEDVDEAMASVARWNELAGGKPDFGKCVQLLRAARPGQRLPVVNHDSISMFSSKDCIDCDEQSCRTASWESAFRNALFSSTQKTLIGLKPSDAAIPPSPTPVLMAEERQTILKDNTIRSLDTSADPSSLGSRCDLCGRQCFAIFVRDNLSVCKPCRRRR